MSGKFKVGELVILQNATYYEEYNGSLGVVTEPLAPRTGLNLCTMESEVTMSYKVRILAEESLDVQATAAQLRKLDDGGDEASRRRRRERPLATA
jgi:hypothetical protein